MKKNEYLKQFAVPSSALDQEGCLDTDSPEGQSLARVIEARALAGRQRRRRRWRGRWLCRSRRRSGRRTLSHGLTGSLLARARSRERSRRC